MAHGLPLAEKRSQAVARDVGGGSRGRRKEVALGRLRTVSLILILGAWGGATKGAAPDDAAAAPSTATRPAPPAPPIKYLEAGAKLFNNAQFDLASKYLGAANQYRDQLSAEEQGTLEAYLSELAKVQASQATAAAAAGPGDAAADSVAPSPTPAAATATPAPAPTPAQAPAPTPVAGGGDSKQRARWLLHEA